MVVRRTHYEKQLEHSFGVHTGHNMAGSVRSWVANHVTVFKSFNFITYLEILTSLLTYLRHGAESFLRS